MFGNLFGDLLGTAGTSAIGSQQAPQPTVSQLSQLANQQFNMAYSQQLIQQNQASQQYNQSLAQQQLGAWQSLAQQRHEWMINGRTMTFEDFLDEICPDPDDPQRTYLTLKYKGIK